MNATRLHFADGEVLDLSGQQIFLDSLEGLENNLTISSPLPGIVSDETLKVIEQVIYQWICSFLCYLGVVDNTVAIIVLKKMGFQDTINISFTVIAFWDLAKGLFGAVPRLNGFIRLFSPAFAHTWYSYSFILLSYSSRNCGYVSGVLAAYVAIIRCLCVSKPLSVKFLLTVKVVSWSNVVISLIVFSTQMFAFARFEYVWVFNPKYNATVAEYVFSSFGLKNPWIKRYDDTLSIAYPVISFTIICICSSVIFYYLRRSSKFRSANKSSEGNQNPKHLSSRDKQVTKMLLVIIIVYIVAYVPRICYYITAMAVPEFEHRRRYANMVLASVYIMYPFDLVNAAINPFIFFFMSSHFRSTLINMLCSSKKAK